MRAPAALLAAAALAHTVDAHGHHGRISRQLAAVQEAVRAAPVAAAVPFALSDVSLAPDSLYGIAHRRNTEFATSLDPSSLTCIFTSAANLSDCPQCPAPGRSGRERCVPLAREMGLGAYYGHYLGHWLSATAFMVNNTGDARARNLSQIVVGTLKRCQEAWGAKYGTEHSGYLFPYDPVVFDMLEERLPWGSVAGRREYSVPFYTLHKIMAGLLDQHTNARHPDALAMASAMGDWVVRNVAATMQRGGQGLWQRVLGTEWGGMNEVMFNLYVATGNDAYLKTGYQFNHWDWSAPLAAGVDDLAGNHANTHIPEVIGNARGFEFTGNGTDKAVVTEFFAAVTQNHSFATGGSNDMEHWGPARQLGDQMNDATQESCTQYNILKVARHLYQWTANSTLFDFYERAILNGILGNQNRQDAVMTSFIYFLPLGAAGQAKPWGKSNDSFPCCWGTLTEQFAKIADSIFFASPDQSAVYVNQFVSASVRWRARGITITQTAAFPESQKSTTTIAFTGAASTFSVYVRVPQWAQGANTVTVDGRPVTVPPPGGYMRLHREWSQSSTIEVYFPLSAWAARLEDDRPQWNATYAWMYGPLVLAGLTDEGTLVPPGGLRPEDAGQFIRRTSETALEFQARGSDGVVLNDSLSFTMMPLLQVVDEHYTVYFQTRAATPVPFAPGGSQVPSLGGDLRFSGGASQNTGPADPRCSGDNVRTGNPGEQSRAVLAHPIVGNGHNITGISLSYRYSAGYTPAPGESRAAGQLSVVLLNARTGEVAARIYDSPPLGDYSYDRFTGYSPPVQVSSKGLSVPNSEPLLMAFDFDNQERNLQMPIDDLAGGWGVTVHWG
eukprot:TRINITY_DN64807_c0_g1_i1.p1 TRINITY_DN64807_c0_g1~~TRINITY_DN64807_c0_g1_i1.p1  ORF type:complete len:863 (+),score=230.70 TRINITY_DN64807_c0_g1_i1:72-2591(+)